MRAWQASYLNRFYRSIPGWVDGTTEFHHFCQRYIQKKNAAVLELGAGPKNKTSAFLKSVSAKLVGLDVDDGIRKNPDLEQAVLYQGGRFPFQDESFDVVVSDYVNEHLESPVAICREIRRVLVKNGVFIFRTPNVYHYVSIVGRFTPHIVSLKLANWLRNLPEGAPEPYLKYYRFNSKKRCTDILKSTGFQILDLMLVEKEPSYGMSSRFLFLPFMVYERMVNSGELLAPLRANIYCAAKKVVGV